MNLKQQIQLCIKNIMQEFDLEDISPVVDYPSDTIHGDYTTNVAMVAAKKLGKNPREIAILLKNKLEDSRFFEKIEVAGPGFVNFWIKDEILIKNITAKLEKKGPFAGKKFVVEFAHPNTHKAFHIGHLRNITTGESIVRLLEYAGARVVRVNYQGDVGMHIAKALYSIMHTPEFAIEHVSTDVVERAIFLGKAYAAGSKAFEEDQKAQEEIKQINKQIYSKDPTILKIYNVTRQWSLDYFETIYHQVGTHFDRYYFESEVYESGRNTVLAGLQKGIFEKSEGAIIFPGSKYGLHDRVFITAEGNPTYEGKEMGLGPLQFEENKPDLIIHVVGPEQAGYFQVVFEALAQLLPETRGKEFHLTYGWVKLKHGKMSSRSGNVVLGEWLISEAQKRAFDLQKHTSEFLSTEVITKNLKQGKAAQKHVMKTGERFNVASAVAIGAIKYSFLKVSTGQEIAFDLDESVSFEGNAGPYVQYTYARTQSVLRKATVESIDLQEQKNMVPEERELLRLLVRFNEVAEDAALRYAPNVVANYLFEVSKAFNLFYQKHQILKEEPSIRDFRLALTGASGKILKLGLHLLGIDAPEKM